MFKVIRRKKSIAYLPSLFCVETLVETNNFFWGGLRTCFARRQWQLFTCLKKTCWICSVWKVYPVTKLFLLFWPLSTLITKSQNGNKVWLLQLNSTEHWSYWPRWHVVCCVSACSACCHNLCAEAAKSTCHRRHVHHTPTSDTSLVRPTQLITTPLYWCVPVCELVYKPEARVE